MRQVMKYVALVELKNQNVSEYLYTLMAAVSVGNHNWGFFYQLQMRRAAARYKARFAFQSNQLKNHVNSQAVAS